MAADDRTPTTPESTAREALERFVVENDDLLELESTLRRFNIFDALGIARVEIRHSNFLAFILDPEESHGQGDLFLKAILMDLLKKAPADIRPLSPVELDGTDLRGVEIKREWKNIDLVITCDDPKFAVVIENKVDSQEHSNQLSRYQRTMAEAYPTVPTLHVYLTPDGDKPSEDSFLSYEYSDIHRVLVRIRRAHQNAIGDDVLVFLDHYLNLLGTRFMNDKTIDSLCRRIYKNHRQALKLILERGSPESPALAEVVSALKEDSRWHIHYQTSKQVDVLLKSWLKWLPPFGPDDYAPFCVNISSNDTNLSCTLFVGPMDDAVMRKRIVNKLREVTPSLGFKRSTAFKVDGKWNRVTGEERFIEWNEADGVDPEVIRCNLKTKLNELHTKLEQLASVMEPLCRIVAQSPVAAHLVDPSR
ncbi:MAG: PD-(D/E)XK nuclease family protein [Planctomycetales bacterium]|nr:PD-(D/E)XK nuclease family protein [Planctomycetales bacterium]